MQFNLYGKRKNFWILFLGLLFAAIIIFFATVQFSRNLKYTVRKKSEQYLKEWSYALELQVEERLAHYSLRLTEIGKQLIEFCYPEDAWFYLELETEEHRWEWIGLYGKDGLETTPGACVEPIDFDWLTELDSSGGEPLIRVHGAYLYATVALEEENVLIACISKNLLSQSLSSLFSEGGRYSEIITQEGEHILSFGAFEEQGNSFLADIDFDEHELDEAGFLTLLRNEAEGTIVLTSSATQDYTARYTSLSIDGWHLVSLVSVETVETFTASLTREAYIVGGITFLLFLVLAIFIAHSYYRHSKWMNQLTLTDPVTGGCTLIAFQLHAKRVLQAAGPKMYAIVSLDIENFELANDTFGIEQGNVILKHVHDTVLETLREEECIARLDGDTFILLLKECEREQIRVRLEEISYNINVRYNPTGTTVYNLPIYMGVHVIRETKTELIILQDRAHVARKKGKVLHQGNKYGAIHFFDREEQEGRMREKILIDRLEQAFLEEQFNVFLQPKVSLGETCSIIGAEALVRWAEPELGLISPGEFIPIMEHNGYITTLDLFVFEQVCKMLSKWVHKDKPLVQISFNLSRAHLAKQDFLTDFLRIFHRYDISASYIQFELTETMVFEHLGTLKQKIAEIQSHGFTVAIDDFGSGYSSLSLLKDVDADVLKLDGAFFGRDADLDEKSKIVLEDILTMAKKLNMKTVCEGVEGASQVAFLRQVNCDEIQGYVFFRPMEQAAFEALLKQCMYADLCAPQREQS